MFKVVHTIHDPNKVTVTEIIDGLVKAFAFPYSKDEDIFTFYAPRVGQPADNVITTDMIFTDNAIRKHAKSCVTAGYRSIYLFVVYSMSKKGPIIKNF